MLCNLHIESGRKCNKGRCLTTIEKYEDAWLMLQERRSSGGVNAEPSRRVERNLIFVLWRREGKSGNIQGGVMIRRMNSVLIAYMAECESNRFFTRSQLTP